MQKIDQLNKARSLLTSALSAALNSMPNNRSVQDARMHMKKALNELDNAANSQVRKKVAGQDNADKWWGHVNGGMAAIAHQPMTREAQQRSLSELNKMIQVENDKIEELEKNSANDTDTEVLND